MKPDISGDFFILLSWCNTKLRDVYSSLGMLCEEEDVDCVELLSRLEREGYRYDGGSNRILPA